MNKLSLIRNILSGEHWKVTRSQLTPAFTASKYRAMYPLIEARVEDLLRELEAERTSQPHVEVQALMTYYVFDVIACCAFGIEVNCLKLKEESEFFKEVQAIFSTGIKTKLMFFLLFLSPWLTAKLGLNLTTDASYPIAILKKTIAERKKSKAKRGDFVDLLLDVLQQQEKSEDNPKYSKNCNILYG